MNNPLEILKSEEYKEARRKIELWKIALALTDNQKTITRIEKDKSKLFNKIKKNKLLLLALSSDQKEFSQLLFKKKTGKEIIID